MTSTTPTLRRAAAGLVAGVVAVLALAGCMRIDVDMTVNSDNTVDASMVFAIADDIAEELGMDPSTLWEEAGPQLTADLPDGATHEPFAEDGFTGTRVTLAREPLDELSGVGGEEISIVREGDEFVLTGSMDLSDTDLSELEGVDLDGMQLRVRVTFPGEVTEHDGALSGTTVTWEPVLGQVNEMNARAEAGEAPGGGGASRTAMIAGLAAVVVGGGTAIALVAKHRRDRQNATTDGTPPDYVVPPGE